MNLGIIETPTADQIPSDFTFSYIHNLFNSYTRYIRILYMGTMRFVLSLLMLLADNHEDD